MHARGHVADTAGLPRVVAERGRPGSRVRTPHSAPPPAHAGLALQRTVGNAAVTRMISRRRHPHGHDDGHDDGPVAQRSTVRDVVRSPGRPLGAGLRAEMEARLGADFTDVRLHTDRAAQRSAAELGARAYTSGHHIVVGAGGLDKHTLAHELTHVIQQRSGPVAGTDRGDGLRVSDPSDPYERAAEANAAQVMRGPVPPVHRAPADQTDIRHDASRPLTVQRYAFLNGQQIAPDDPGLQTERMREFAADSLVRDYQSWDEFRDHAAGATDYLGHLWKDGREIWVRFSPQGTNIIGEQHVSLTLPDVLKAVGSTSFIYEPFVFEGLAGEENTRKAYQENLESTAEKLRAGGVEVGPDWTQHAAESLYPKVGEAMSLLRETLAKGTLDNYGARGVQEYLGRITRRFLRIAWAHAKDLKRMGGARTERQAKLVDVYNDVKNRKGGKGLFRDSLDEFVTKNLRGDGHLGDDLATYPQFEEPIRRFLEALIDELLERDSYASTIALPGSAPGVPLNWGDKGHRLGQARNRHFEDAVRRAGDSGVRYAGMGLEHSDYLRKRAELPGNFHFYDLVTNVTTTLQDESARARTTLAQFKEATETLRSRASGQST